jgi:hypothetical protein
VTDTAFIITRGSERKFPAVEVAPSLCFLLRVRFVAEWVKRWEVKKFQ